MKKIPSHILARFVAESMLEDLGPGDITTSAIVPEETRARGEIRAREPIILAGIDAAILGFRLLDPSVEILEAQEDGSRLPADSLALRIAGSARALLSGERTALNILGRLSGIATMTGLFVDAAGGHPVRVSDTRKTTPTLRLFEKYAVAVGGGENHRFGLYDAILIKNNHVDLAGGIAAAVRSAREKAGGDRSLEVEVRSQAELDEALQAGADAVLLDNFDMRELEAAVGKARGKALVEVSGGIRLDSVAAIAALGVDRISVGALTHSAPSANLNMRMTTWTR